jgi:hypothetical protein
MARPTLPGGPAQPSGAMCWRRPRRSWSSAQRGITIRSTSNHVSPARPSATTGSHRSGEASRAPGKRQASRLGMHRLAVLHRRDNRRLRSRSPGARRAELVLPRPAALRSESVLHQATRRCSRGGPALQPAWWLESCCLPCSRLKRCRSCSQGKARGRARGPAGQDKQAALRPEQSRRIGLEHKQVPRQQLALRPPRRVERRKDRQGRLNLLSRVEHDKVHREAHRSLPPLECKAHSQLLHRSALRQPPTQPTPPQGPRSRCLCANRPGCKPGSPRA